jgi:hypothetical protein
MLLMALSVTISAASCPYSVPVHHVANHVARSRRDKIGAIEIKRNLLQHTQHEKAALEGR